MEATRRGRKAGSRNYPREFRELVVSQANNPERSIADVAQEHGLNANMIARWRKAASLQSDVVPRSSSPVFIPVQLPSPASVSGAVILEHGGVRIRFEAPLDTQALRVVLAALREKR